MLTEATKFNLMRKAHWADHVQLHEGVPMWSWLEINPTELCNRVCSFCPRADPNVYPNQNLNMSLRVARTVANELLDLKYEGAVVLCGYGEPLLHPQLHELCECFSAFRLEIVTNGDLLTGTMAKTLVEAGVDYFLVSMYDGPEQKSRFEEVFHRADLGPDYYVLRDRWHGADKDFGLKLTNRAGTINVGNQEEVDRSRPCFYPSYQLMLDWNGDVLLCVQDWQKKLRFGNVMSQSLWDTWMSSAFRGRRKRLLNGKRSSSPCSECNADGCLHGSQHAAVWRA